MHHMLNIVTNRKGEGAAVLIRACEPVSGLHLVRERRGALQGPVLLTGPGKVGAALALDTRASGHCLFRPGMLELREGTPPAAIVSGPRIGIAYASKAHQRAPWRLAIADCEWVAKRRELRALNARERSARSATR
jgi:DNA-3-methyladenine glycosylase